MVWQGEKGLSGKEGVCSSRGAFRNTPVAAWEGFAVTTSFGVRVQKSIVFLRDRVMRVTAKAKMCSGGTSQNIQQIQHVRASTEKSSLMLSKDFRVERSTQDMPRAISFPKNRVLILPFFSPALSHSGKCQL